MAKKVTKTEKNYTSLPLPFSFEEEELLETRRQIKTNEQVLRSEAKIFLDKPSQDNNFPPLIIPLRWEVLKAEAERQNVPLKPLILPVQEAIAEIERELKRIEETRMGKLLVLSGVSGSGKTTYLNSLDLFIDRVVVHNFRGTSLDRRDYIESALIALKRDNLNYSIVVLEGREAEGSLTSEEIDTLMTVLNADFRHGYGRRTLFVMPTTSNALAYSISQRAKEIGGMTSLDKPTYPFSGPRRSDYITIVNDTIRALNDSRTLLDYGISDETARGLAESSNSIGAFMETCHTVITQQRERLTSVATSIKRKRVHLWMVFCSYEENTRRNHDIIRSLTVGSYQHVQVERILNGDSQEVRFWETMQGVFAQAAQYLDLRIMYLPLRTANAIMTAYGSRELIKKLQESDLIERAATRSSAQESLEGTAIWAFLQKEGFFDKDPSKRGTLTEKRQEQFKLTIKYCSDKELNSAVASALRDLNKDPEIQVVTELALNDVSKPNEHARRLVDIAIVTPTDIYCLELKWRSSVLNDADVVRETAERVAEYASELTELKVLLDSNSSR